MKKTRQEDILLDIRERVVKIETHLGDMNGRLIKHDDFLTNKCPEKHLELDRKITKVMTIISIITIVAVTVINITITKMMG